MEEKHIFSPGNQLKAFPFSVIFSRRLPPYLAHKVEIKLTAMLSETGILQGKNLPIYHYQPYGERTKVTSLKIYCKNGSL